MIRRHSARRATGLDARGGRRAWVVSAPLLAVSLLAACVDDGGDPYADEVVALTPAADSNFGHDRLPEIVLGAPGGTLDVASLGCDGEIILRFDEPGILDGPGVDLIVFENPFSTDFPEPGEVAVSEDGQTWLSFPCDPVTLTGCAGVTPTLALPDSGIDPRDPDHAGGDGFDLADLAAVAGAEAPAQVYFVRIRDRSRAYWQSIGQEPWCDPGQQGAGGFDLDAVVAVHG